MTQLANANLLDESVANSGSLKNQRLNKTAQTASNPNPNPVLKKVEMENDNDDENEVEKESYQKLQDEFRYSDKLEQKKEKNDDKILGMSKPLAIGLGIVVLATVAYFGYKYYKKSKIKSTIGTSNLNGADVLPKT